MVLKTLYGKDKLGRIKEWDVVIESHENGSASFTITHGLSDGKKTSTTRTIHTGKNIGKSNETTPYEQACLEARSRWNKQLDKGYMADANSIKLPHEVEYFLPMLAERYDKYAKYIRWPAYVNPKLDGCRAVSKKENGKVTIWSRKGKIIDVPKEIIKDLEDILDEGESFDGEIYVHEWRTESGQNDFQRIMSAVKKYGEDTPSLQYHVYDRPVFSMPFKKRFVEKTFKETDRVRRVETILVNNEEEMLFHYERYISGSLPYEGLMIRNVNGKYLYAHRTKDLQKVKPLDDDEFEIVGGQEAAGDDAGTVVFRCVTKDGQEFDVRPIGTREARREYFENLDSYVGKMLTVEFNGLTNDGKPRFPRGVKIRPSWDM